MSDQQKMAPAGHRERALRELIEGSGTWRSDRYEFTAAKPNVSVRDRVTGFLVAYSGTAADFEDSVAEFVRDFL